MAQQELQTNKTTSKGFLSQGYSRTGAFQNSDSQLLQRSSRGCFRRKLSTITRGIIMAQTLVYDVTRKATFTGLGRWLNELEMHTTPSSTVKMLVGNKTDKPEREVERKEGLQLARKHSLLFIETSAKTQDGVHHAFEELVIKILQTPDLWDKGTGKKGIQLMESSAQQHKGLCAAYCALL
ncbi:ras-related protein Rab-18-B isoform X2 [Zonotrichia albicollis]|uniref:ras-related protein Rab-18-B isoform X2 n=1 Tax=Zonotrichia albicollis TaxID=44394 RepID=UPI003D80CAF8